LLRKAFEKPAARLRSISVAKAEDSDIGIFERAHANQERNILFLLTYNRE
jgi:hypothetical protein